MAHLAIVYVFSGKDVVTASSSGDEYFPIPVIGINQGRGSIVMFRNSIGPPSLCRQICPASV